MPAGIEFPLAGRNNGGGTLWPPFLPKYLLTM